MGILDIFKRPDINAEVEEFRNTPGALLADVRGAEEYAGGHIPGSVNLPLPTLAGRKSIGVSKDSPVYVYCLSGARSAQAAAMLRRIGYNNVKNIGGIAGYKGEVEY